MGEAIRVTHVERLATARPPLADAAIEPDPHAPSGPDRDRQAARTIIRCVRVDGTGNLWIGTAGSGSIGLGPHVVSNRRTRHRCAR